MCFLFLSARSRMLPSNSPNALNAPKPAKPALGAAKLYGLQALQTLQTFQNLPNWRLELPNYRLWQAKSFLFYWPETAGWSLQTLRTFQNLPNRLWQAKSFLFYWPETAGWSLKTLRTTQTPRQIFPFLLARNCRMVPSNAPNHTTRRNLPNWLLELPNRLLEMPNYGCGKPNLSFSTGPKLPDGPFKRSKPSKPLKTSQTGSWSCHTSSWSWQTIWAVASQVFPFYWPETAGWQTLQNLPNRVLELNYRLWQAKSFLFYWPETAGWSLKSEPPKPLETCQTGSWSCQTGS